MFSFINFIENNFIFFILGIVAFQTPDSDTAATAGFQIFHSAPKFPSFTSTDDDNSEFFWNSPTSSPNLRDKVQAILHFYF